VSIYRGKKSKLFFIIVPQYNYAKNITTGRGAFRAFAFNGKNKNVKTRLEKAMIPKVEKPGLGYISVIYEAMHKAPILAIQNERPIIYVM
jgi:hypothetical protein